MFNGQSLNGRIELRYFSWLLVRNKEVSEEWIRRQVLSKGPAKPPTYSRAAGARTILRARQTRFIGERELLG